MSGRGVRQDLTRRMTSEFHKISIILCRDRRPRDFVDTSGGGPTGADCLAGRNLPYRKLHYLYKNDDMARNRLAVAALPTVEIYSLIC